MTAKYSIGKYEVTAKEVKEILTSYFSKLSNRTYRFLYVNKTQLRNGIFTSVNVIGRDLIKIYNPEIRFRISCLSNKKHIAVIEWVLSTVLGQLSTKVTYVVNILQIITMLNKVNYDFGQLNVTEDERGVFTYPDNTKNHIVCFVERDVQNIIFVTELFDVYHPFIGANNDDGVDIRSRIEAGDKSIEVPLDKKINVTLHNGIDYPAKKYLSQTECEVIAKFIYDTNGVKLVTLAKIPDEYKCEVLTSRVYIVYYYKKRKKQ